MRFETHFYQSLEFRNRMWSRALANLFFSFIHHDKNIKVEVMLLRDDTNAMKAKVMFVYFCCIGNDHVQDREDIGSCCLVLADAREEAPVSEAARLEVPLFWPCTTLWARKIEQVMHCSKQIDSPGKIMWTSKWKGWDLCHVTIMTTSKIFGNEIDTKGDIIVFGFRDLML